VEPKVIPDEEGKDAGPAPGIEIRTARVDELEALGDIENDAAQQFRSVGYHFCADGPVRSAEEKLAALRLGAVLVAVKAGAPIGFALLVPCDGRAHLLELAVRRSNQGRGLGRLLVARAEAWARCRGFREITLTTFRDVPWNAPFYRRLGYRRFTPAEDQPQLLAVQGEEAASGFAIRPRIAMRKALRSPRRGAIA